MRLLPVIIVAALILTALRAAIVVLVIVVFLSLVWGALFRTAETFGLLLLMMFMSVLNQQPLAVLSLIGFLGFIALMQKSPTPSGPVNAADPMRLPPPERP